jgi:hypothetical protein
VRALSHALSVADVSSWVSLWVLESSCPCHLARRPRHVGGDSDKGPESHVLSRLKRKKKGGHGVAWPFKVEAEGAGGVGCLVNRCLKVKWSELNCTGRNLVVIDHQ